MNAEIPQKSQVKRMKNELLRISSLKRSYPPYTNIVTENERKADVMITGCIEAADYIQIAARTVMLQNKEKSNFMSY